MKRLWLVLIVSFFSIGTAFSNLAPTKDAEPVKELFLCCEARDWYPFIYTQADEVMGMHIDIVREAARRAGFQVKIRTYPFKRCIRMAEHKEVDGMISIVYDKEYAPYLEYPPNTPNIKESAWAIMQVDDVLVTPAENGYEFTGDIGSIPGPVRVLENDPTVSYLTQAGITVEESDADRQNIAKLIRDKKGSVIMSSVMAEALSQDEAFKGKIKIGSPALRSQAYFLAFSWGSKLLSQDRKRIWDEIERVRKDYIFMLALFAQY